MNSLFGKIKNASFMPLLKNRLFKNMSWLFILNFSNAIVPYFTFPYITRIFLPEGYGIVSFSLSFVAYFQTFINYGFNLTGARKIAIAEGDEGELSRIYTSIISTKFLFFLISLPLIIIITLLNSKLFECRSIIFIFILIALGNVLMPVWLFQGLQRVRDMTIISLTVRTAFMICVFILIKSPSDIPLYAVLYSASFLTIGIISMVVVRIQIKVKFCKINFADIINMIKDGFYVFTSSAVISVMGSTGILVLGLFYSSEYSGYYSGISKINKVITMLFYPVGQALFPYHSKKYAVSFKNGYSSAIRIAKMVIPLFAFFAVIVSLLRKPIVLLALGEDYVSVANLLIIMSFLPLISIMSNFIGTQILVASGHTKEYSRAFLRGSLVSVSLYFTLGYFYEIWGVAIAAVIGSITNLVLLYFEVHRILINYKET